MNQCLLCSQRIGAPVSLALLMSFKAYQSPVICNQCRNRFERVASRHHCRECSRVGDFRQSLCDDCRRWRQMTGVPFRNYGLYRYNPMMSDYMKRYKFNGDYRLRMVFQNDFSRFARNQNRLLIPIPIHERTYRRRGFNQVMGLLGSVPVTKALATITDQKRIPQSQKSRAERLKLSQPFKLITGQRSRIVGRDVAVVDDVYTTGTTVRHAARLLTSAGARSVVGITLAR